MTTIVKSILIRLANAATISSRNLGLLRPGLVVAKAANILKLNALNREVD